MPQFIKVAKTSDIPVGEVRSFVVETEVVAICNVNGKFYVIRDECTHMNYPLSDGIFEGEVITCNYHGAEFNVTTGEALSLPAVDPVEAFQVKVEGDDIYVSLDD